MAELLKSQISDQST